MTSVRIYKYPTRMSAVIITGKERNSNMPIQNSRLRVHKGANIPLDFTLFDADGKPFTYDGTNKHLELKVFDTSTETLLMTKRLIKVPDQTIVPGALTPSVRNNNFKRSVYRTTIESRDTMNLEAGTHYRWVVQENDNHYNVNYFFSSLGYDIAGELEISNSAIPRVELSEEITQWTTITNPAWMDRHIVGDDSNVHKLQWTKYNSEAVAGDAEMNVTNGLHTVVIYPEEFSGVVQVQACIDNELPDSQAEHHWFNVPDITGTTNLCLTNCDTPSAINFTGNFTWMRVVFYTMNYPSNNPGKINRVLVRR